jgi:hypothetical protein
MNDKRQKLVFDFRSARREDANGFLHVDMCPITKAQVSEYWGLEIPNAAELNLNPREVYPVLRPSDELEKAVSSANGIPILDEHIDEHDSANPAKEKRIGSTGTRAVWQSPYIRNDLAFWDDATKADVESGKRKELSCGYTYDPILESGVFEGKPYKIKMSNIRFNHVALVQEGRAGSDVKVLDGKIQGEINMADKSGKIGKDAAPDFPGSGSGKPPGGNAEEGGEKAENRVIAGIKKLVEELGGGAKEDSGSPGVTDEEKETLKKVMDFVNSFVGGGGDCKDENAENNNPDKPGNAGASDKDFPDNGKAGASDKDFPDNGKAPEGNAKTGDRKTVKALDAETIKREIRQQMTDEFNARNRAIEDVESLIGSTARALTMDSAEMVYRHALQTHGIEIPKGINMAGLKGMVAILKKQRANGSVMALDRAPRMDDEESKLILDIRKSSPYAAQVN